MTDAKERKAEMISFLGRFPDATTAQVVDHMMEKFEDSKPNWHRGMLYRVRPEPPTPEAKAKAPNPEPVQGGLFADTTTTKRTSSKKKNPANKPKPKRDPVAPIFILEEDTAERQERVVELYNPLKPQSERGLLRAIKKEFTEPADPPTLAMITQCLRVDGDLERYTANMEKLFGHAKCPTCDRTAEGVDDIYVWFGFREQNKRRQSYCRKCRSENAKAKKKGAK